MIYDGKYVTFTKPIPSEYILLGNIINRQVVEISVNRVGETGLFPVSTSHTTVRTVRYTAVH